MEKVTTYFEIDARAGMAYDLDTGDDAPAYLQVSTEHNKALTDDERQQVHDAHKLMVCDQIEIPEEYLKRISKEDYDAEMEEEADG